VLLTWPAQSFAAVNGWHDHARTSQERKAMESGSRRSHWESIYSAKGETGISWFQETPVPSLELLELAGAQPSSAIVDAGG
jgi:hypothetical protein